MPSSFADPVARPFWARSPVMPKTSWLLPDPLSPTIAEGLARGADRSEILSTAVTVPSGVSKADREVADFEKSSWPAS